MGQCPMTPPSSYGCWQEDERSVSSTQNEASVCSVEQSNTASFLVAHRPDLPMRCMLDPSHVFEIILHQAEAMSRQVEQISRLQDTSLEEDCESEGDYAMSAFAAGTEVTSFSVATRLVSNSDRYSQAKPRFNSAKFTRAKPPGGIASNRSKQRAMEAIHENNGFDSNTSGAMSRSTSQHSLLGGTDSPSHQSAGQNRNRCIRGLSNGLSAQLHSSLLSAKTALGPFFACVGVHPKKSTFSEDEFYDVLHLKMKLSLSEYYLNHYLAVFPHSPRPVGIQHPQGGNAEEAPRLSSTSSDSSTVTPEAQGVGFGSGIPSSPVRLLADDSSFMDIAISGALGLVGGKVGQGSPARASSSSKQKSPEHYIVLINQRSGVPLAVCALKSRNGPPVVRIYATKQRVVGQRPAASTGHLGLTWTDSYPLFAWAEFTTEGEFPMPVQYSLFMASGSEGRFEKEPSYRAYHPTTGSPDIAMVGRTQTEREHSGCALLSMVTDEQNEPFLSISIARGVDPALLICFAAIADETMEKTMRLHCELNEKKQLRRSRSRNRTPLRMSWD